ESSRRHFSRDRQSPISSVAAAGQEVIVLKQDQPYSPVADQVLHLVHHQNGIPAASPARSVAIVKRDDRAEGALVGTAPRRQYRSGRQRMTMVCGVGALGPR